MADLKLVSRSVCDIPVWKGLLWLSCTSQAQDTGLELSPGSSMSLSPGFAQVTSVTHSSLPKIGANLTYCPVYTMDEFGFYSAGI